MWFPIKLMAQFRRPSPTRWAGQLNMAMGRTAEILDSA